MLIARADWRDDYRYDAAAARRSAGPAPAAAAPRDVYAADGARILAPRRRRRPLARRGRSPTRLARAATATLVVEETSAGARARAIRRGGRTGRRETVNRADRLRLYQYHADDAGPCSTSQAIGRFCRPAPGSARSSSPAAPRSGSTWVGNVLSLDRAPATCTSRSTQTCTAGRCRADFRHASPTSRRDTEAAYLPPLRDTLAWRYSLGAELRRPRTPARRGPDGARSRLFRDDAPARRPGDPEGPDGAASPPTGSAARFDARVVVVIRHPAAFVASLRAAGWAKFRFRILRDQPALMARAARAVPAEIAAAAATMPDAVDVGTLLWRVLHHHIDLLRREHPDWIFVRHEDLSRDPEPEFRDALRPARPRLHRRGAAQLAGFTAGAGALEPAVAVPHHLGAPCGIEPGQPAGFRCRLAARRASPGIRRHRRPLARRLLRRHRLVADQRRPAGTCDVPRAEHPRRGRARAKARNAASGLRSGGRPLACQSRRHSASRK